MWEREFFFERENTPFRETVLFYQRFIEEEEEDFLFRVRSGT